jgi:hypothetical protein
MAASSSHGGKRSKSGRNPSSEYRLFAKCMLPKDTGNGEPCQNQFTGVEFACVKHRETHAERYPTLHRMMSALKSKHYETYPPLKKDFMNEELEKTLNTCSFHCYTISCWSPMLAASKKETIEAYLEIYKTVKGFGIVLTSEDEQFITDLCQVYRTLKDGDEKIWQQHYKEKVERSIAEFRAEQAAKAATVAASKVEAEMQKVKDVMSAFQNSSMSYDDAIAMLEQMKEREMKRALETERKITEALKAKNDIAEMIMQIADLDMKERTDSDE